MVKKLSPMQEMLRSGWVDPKRIPDRQLQMMLRLKHAVQNKSGEVRLTTEGKRQYVLVLEYLVWMMKTRRPPCPKCGGKLHNHASGCDFAAAEKVVGEVIEDANRKVESERATVSDVTIASAMESIRAIREAGKK